MRTVLKFLPCGCLVVEGFSRPQIDFLAQNETPILLKTEEEMNIVKYLVHGPYPCFVTDAQMGDEHIGARTRRRLDERAEEYTLMEVHAVVRVPTVRKNKGSWIRKLK